LLNLNSEGVFEFVFSQFVLPTPRNQRLKKSTKMRCMPNLKINFLIKYKFFLKQHAIIFSKDYTLI